MEFVGRRFGGRLEVGDQLVSGFQDLQEGDEISMVACGIQGPSFALFKQQLHRGYVEMTEQQCFQEGNKTYRLENRVDGLGPPRRSDAEGIGDRDLDRNPLTILFAIESERHLDNAVL